MQTRPGGESENVYFGYFRWVYYIVAKYVSSRQYQNSVGEVDDGHDKNRYVGNINDSRDMP